MLPSKHLPVTPTHLSGSELRNLAVGTLILQLPSLHVLTGTKAQKELFLTLTNRSAAKTTLTLAGATLARRPRPSEATRVPPHGAGNPQTTALLLRQDTPLSRPGER